MDDRSISDPEPDTEPADPEQVTEWEYAAERRRQARAAALDPNGADTGMPGRLATVAEGIWIQAPDTGGTAYRRGLAAGFARLASPDECPYPSDVLIPGLSADATEWHAGYRDGARRRRLIVTPAQDGECGPVMAYSLLDATAAAVYRYLDAYRLIYSVEPHIYLCGTFRNVTHGPGMDSVTVDRPARVIGFRGTGPDQAIIRPHGGMPGNQWGERSVWLRDPQALFLILADPDDPDSLAGIQAAADTLRMGG